MSLQIEQKLTAYGFGAGAPGSVLPPTPLPAQRDPLATDHAQAGQMIINLTTNAIFLAASTVNNATTWVNIGNGAGTFTSMTINPGNLEVTLGNIVVPAGSITATTGLVFGNTVASGTTVTGGTGVIATTGNVRADSGGITGTVSSVDTLGSFLILSKSRAGGIITTGDNLGNIIFTGEDGPATTVVGAFIAATTTGTIGAGRVPTIMTFATAPDAVSTAVERMRIPADGGINILAPTTATTPPLVLPGPINIYTGAGAPANGLAVHVGDMYINTTAASAVTRLYIATAANTWTNVTCAA